MSQYVKMFKPLRVRNTVFKNRIFGAPILPMSMTDEHARPSESHIAHFVSKARGGAASLTISGYGFRPNEVESRKPFFDLYNIPNQRVAARLADAIHAYGTVASIEAPFFNSYGYTASGGQITGAGATPNSRESKGEMPEEIMNILADEYAEFAGIVQDLGFDMMMFHFAHGNILSQFLSPFWNKRTDKYGGSVENRARFPIMIIDRVRERVGKNFLLEMRVSGDEKRLGGITIDQTIDFLKLVEGKIDIVQMSTGGFAINLDELLYPSLVMPSDYMPDTPHIRYARQAKESGVKMVIGAMGAVQNADAIESILESGAADVVYIARGLIAEPELATKAHYRPGEIRPCIKCYHCVDTQMRFACSVNPTAGREIWAEQLKHAPAARKVAVVGGGPAGMNAAIAAARFGHDVTLYEKRDKLGGRIVFGDKIEFKRAIGKYKEYLIEQIGACGARVELGVDVTRDLLEREKYEHVVVAIGAEQVPPPIKGIGKNTVLVGDIYEKNASVEGDVVIIGGGFSGVESAIYLARLGHKVTLIEQAEALCGGMQFGTKHLEYYRVAVGTLREEEQITAVTGAVVEEITDTQVIFSKDGEKHSIDAQTVVVATGMRPKEEQALALIPDGVASTLIGDCRKAEDIEYATRTGFDAAASIR